MPLHPRHIVVCPPIPPFPHTTTEKPLLESRTVGGFIERMWAYKTIKKLLKDSKLVDSKEERDKKKDRALELSLKVQGRSVVCDDDDSHHMYILYCVLEMIDQVRRMTTHQ